jgi:hypothetical protein
MDKFAFLEGISKYEGLDKDLQRLELRHKFLIEPFEDTLNGATVLDIAAYDGRWSYAFSDQLFSLVRHFIWLLWYSVSLITRYREGEGTAFSNLAFEVQLPSVRLYQITGNGKTKTRSPELAARGRVNLTECLEYPRDMFIRDTKAGVAYAYHNPKVIVGGFQRNAALVGELCGIAQ